MKELAGTIFAGIGILIFAYLLFSHGSQATSILNSGLGNSNTVIKTLQGR